MIPKFSSQSDMISFLRALPNNSDYAAMLKSDFGVIAPEGAQSFHKEYYYKYLVQGKYLGKENDELFEYAKVKTLKFAEDFPHVIQKFIPNEPEPVVATRTYQKRTSGVMHGVIVWNEKFEKYDGYVDGKVVTRASTVEKCNHTMVTKYNVTGSVVE